MSAEFHAEKYPEHQKLKAFNHKTEIVHEFLEWVRDEHKFELCRYADNDYGAYYDTLTTRARDAALSEFIGVDLKKIEDEKRAMLDEIRASQEVKNAKD